MTDTPISHSSSRENSAVTVWRSPLLWLGFVMVTLLFLLCLPIVLPIGPMYWDSYIYLDAAQRIKMGQIPGVDFFTPVGPLGYYLFAWGLNIFSGAQLLLLAQWAMLAVAAPLMALVLADMPREKRGLAFTLLIPFLVFGIFPANVPTYQSYPGVDGFGIYNRHANLLLYVLVSALVFMKDGRKLLAVCTLAMLALFLTKITGFLAGGLIGLIALLAGRLSLKSVLTAALIFVAALACLELNDRMISAYLSDIARLVGMNEGALLPRFLTVFSLKLDIILAAGVLFLFLVWSSRKHLRGQSGFFDQGFVWLAVTMLAGVFLETQNTGSQEFIFVWPVLLMIYERSKHGDERQRLIIVCLVALTAIPTFTKVAHKTLRALAVAPTYIAAPVTEMKNMNLVSARPEIMQRTLLLEENYSKYPMAYEDLAENGQLPSWQYYSELDYQMYWIISADHMVKALKQFEADNGIRLNTMMNLDFVNPFPWILDRDATRHIQIGGDPFRTVPDLDPDTKSAIDATDGILRPLCPTTSGRLALQKIYAEALEGRTVIKLNDCWELLLRPGIKLAQ